MWYTKNILLENRSILLAHVKSNRENEIYTARFDLAGYC